jgi:hypothetical protein
MFLATFVIGLSGGVFIGFFTCAMFSVGRYADSPTAAPGYRDECLDGAGRAARALARSSAGESACPILLRRRLVRGRRGFRRSG